MPRSCTVCSRADTAAINELLRAGESARSVAGRFDVGKDALLRHARRHVHPPVDIALPPRESDPLEELATALRARALGGSDSAAREYRLALHDQQAARHAVGPSRELASEPEWLDLRARILAALQPFPEARQAVADALVDN